MAKSTQSVPLLAVPFFILAANLMNALGLTQRIFDFAVSIVGFIRGGLAQVNVLASMVFAGISGAAVADAANVFADVPPKNMTARPALRQNLVDLSRKSLRLMSIGYPLQSDTRNDRRLDWVTKTWE